MMPSLVDIPSGAHWVRFPRFFGDALMIHAAIAPLRQAGMPLVAWGPEWVLDLFRGAEGYQAAVPEPSQKYRPLEAAKLLRQHRPASVINFPKSHRPMLASFLARVPLRLGCGDGGAWLFYTHSVPFWSRDDHAVVRYASVVKKAFPGLPDASFLPFRPRAEALICAADVQKRLGLGPYAVFAPGGNCGSKRLGLRLFAEMGRRLEQQGIRVVVLGAGADDLSLVRELREQCPSVLDRVGQGGLADSAAWVAGAGVLLGGDSGLAHLAAACGTPTVAVFGPTCPRHTAPMGPHVTVLRREDLPCLECMAWSCPLPDHPCMHGVDADQLWASLSRSFQ